MHSHEAHVWLWLTMQTSGTYDTLGAHCNMKVNWAPGCHTVSQRTIGASAMAMVSTMSILIVVTVGGAMVATALRN